MKTFAQVWNLLSVSQRRSFVLLQFVSVAMAFSTIGGIASIIPFFSVLADPHAIETNAMLRWVYSSFHFSNQRDFVATLGLYFVCIVILANAVNWFGASRMNRFADRVGCGFHVALFREYLYRDYGFHARSDRAILLGNVLYEVSRLTSGILRSGLSLITNVVTVLLIVASMLLLNSTIALLALGGLGGSYAVAYVIVRAKLRRNGLIETRFLAERTRIVDESFRAVKTVAIFRAEGLIVEKFFEACDTLAKAMSNTWSIAQSPRYIFESLTVLGLVGAAIYLSGGAEVGRAWLGQLTFMTFAAYRLLPALQQAFSSIVRLRADRAAFESVATDLDQSVNARLEDPNGPGVAMEGGLRQHLRFNNVWFQYAKNPAPAIRDVTLTIPARAMVGILGANGSGKTTLIDLALGLLTPQIGSIEVDGVALTGIDKSTWWSSVAYVPQQVVLVDATIAENIAFGIAVERIDMSRVREAAGLARLEEFVASLPQGYEERVADGGARYSGGQRQRLGLARALYRKAALLVLDEATSALDRPAEIELIEVLAELRNTTTVVMVAHRLDTMRHCDLIVRLEHGRVTASGSYEELSRRSA